MPYASAAEQTISASDRLHLAATIILVIIVISTIAGIALGVGLLINAETGVERGYAIGTLIGSALSGLVLSLPCLACQALGRYFVMRAMETVRGR